jgi:uncharacterized membrane protein (DUF373 family)
MNEKENMEKSPDRKKRFNSGKIFERVIITTLMIMMVLVVFLATIELGWHLINEIISPPYFLLGIDDLLEIFGMFLLVLIGIELLETIKTYLLDNIIRVEVVFLVAIIAISRKVIIMELKEQTGINLLGIAAIILALSVGFYLFKRSFFQK